jgi:hypothetical protein
VAEQSVLGRQNKGGRAREETLKGGTSQQKKMCLQQRKNTTATSKHSQAKRKKPRFSKRARQGGTD